MHSDIHTNFMLEAYDLACIALENDEVPVGALVVLDNQVIGRGFNQVILKNSPVFHAEILAINEACRHLENFRLNNCVLYSTLEPCHMCAKAIVDARIEKLFFGAYEPKTGSVESVDNFFDKSFLNHYVKYQAGIEHEKCSAILKDFFQKKRLSQSRDNQNYKSP
jgi:tRNA(adenine34) deaminase